MKRLNILLLLTVLLLSNYAGASSPAILNHTVADQERSIGNFKGIAAGGPINVKITIGNKESLRMEGNQDAIADIITEVKEGILTIRPKTKWNEWSRKYNRPNVTVYITAKRITSLTMSGSGNMDVQQMIVSSDLVATLSGSGSINGAANVKSLTGVISGSGNINLNGKADNSNFTLSGSGNFNGKNFSVDATSIQISGSANVQINVSHSINAVISGSGNVLYHGNPTISKTVIGSGSVKKM